MRLDCKPARDFRNLLLVICCLIAQVFPLTLYASERLSCRELAPIVFGFLPFVSAEQLVIRFTPLTQYLSKQLRTPVRIETAPDFVEFARRTHEEQRYDILFTAPHFYPQARSKAGYRLVASVDSPGMWAVIVAPKQSGINELKDLVGKKVATVHPAGLATLLARKHLAEADLDPDVDITMISTPTHDASLLSSYHGITDASILMSPPYETASRRVKETMHVVARTESTPHIPISVSPRISDECKSEISDVLLNMADSDEGREALNQQTFSGFKKATPEDYEKIRDLLAR